MRKRNILIIFALTIFQLIGFTQSNNNSVKLNSTKQQVDYSQKVERLIIINDSLAIRNRHLKSGIDNLTSKSVEAIKKLNDDEKFFNRIDIYFTIIAAILAVFTILSPIIILTAGIWPARKAISNLKKTVHEFIISREKESIDYAIKQLFSDSEKSRYEAAFLLSNRIDFRYSSDDVNKIIEAHSKIKDTQTKFLIRNILSNQATLEVDKFFRNIVKSTNLNLNLYHVIRYLSISNSDFTSEFIQALRTNESPFGLYSLLINQSMNASFSLALDFANNQTLIDYVISKTEFNQLKSITDNISSTAKVYNYEGLSEISNSKLSTRIRELEELEKTKNDEKKKEEQAKISKVKTNKDIIKQYGVRKVDNKYIDSSGSELKQTQIVQTMIGPQEIQQVVRIGDVYVNIKDIPNENNEG
jgi:regulator of replication initiation timing